MRLPRAERSLDPMYKWIATAIFSHGDPAAALNAVLSGDLHTSGDLFEISEAARARVDAESEVARWQEHDLRPLAIGDLGYPAQLFEIADPPPLIFFEGALSVLGRPGVAVVGTRNPSTDGLRRTKQAVRALVDAGLVVFSGLAKGIDSAAHQASIDLGGLTVAVMGTPIDRRYPVENSALAARIVDSGGALVSEFLPDGATHRWHFLRRNRTMSGLAIATLVIEASETSGARSQAVAALDQGRPVFLPESLVEAHPWALRLVSEGRNGVRAICVSKPSDMADALIGHASDSAEPPAF